MRPDKAGLMSLAEHKCRGHSGPSFHIKKVTYVTNRYAIVTNGVGWGDHWQS
jgi:hypothetical protein